MNVPNALSLLRIFAVPLFIWMVVQEEIDGALWLFIGAALTDGLDGYIAKRFDLRTVLGSYLDPIADKLLLVSAFVTLTVANRLPLWLTLLVVTRDLVIIGGALVIQLTTASLRMEPLSISKVNTFMQILLLMGVMGSQVYGFDELWLHPLLGLTVLTTVSSGLSYVWIWMHRAAQVERQRTP